MMRITIDPRLRGDDTLQNSGFFFLCWYDTLVRILPCPGRKELMAKKITPKAAVSKKAVSQKKKPARTVKTKRASSSVVEAPMMSEVPSTIVIPEQRRPLSQRIAMMIGGALLIVGLVLATNKSLLVVATVNGQPIFRWELSKVLMDQFGKQMVDAMITERLIADAARQSNVVISQKDIDEKQQEIVKSFGGKVTVEELLKFQGMTKASFDSQIKTQLIVSKIVGKDITISDADIAAYLEKNAETLTATDEATLKSEAKTALFNQKVSEKVQPWFTAIRTKANIQTFVQ